MQGYWLRPSASGVLCGEKCKSGICVLSENVKFRSPTSQSQLCISKISARCMKDASKSCSGHNDNGNNNWIWFTRREFSGKTPKIVAVIHWGDGFCSAPRPSIETGRSEFRARCSAKTFEERLDDSLKWQLDDKSSVATAGEPRVDGGCAGPKKAGIGKKKKALYDGLNCSEIEVAEGCESVEEWGDVPKKAVSEDGVGEMCQTLRESCERELTACGKANVRLLLALGADKKQVEILFGKHPKLHEERAAAFLLKSARLFHDFDMDAHVLLQAIIKLSAEPRRNMLIRSASDGHKNVLTFFREEIGMKSLAKLIARQPALLSYSRRALQERKSTLESLGVVVDGDFVEKYSTIFKRCPVSLRETAQALDLALGPGIFLRDATPLAVSPENVPKRVANLTAVVGDSLPARELLLVNPNILISREETVRETWCKLVETFGKDGVVRSVRGSPHILARNWKSIHPKLEYLKSKGFSREEVLTCLSAITFGSLEGHIKPRVEVAVESVRVQEGSFSLSTILSGKTASFQKRFGVQL